jgi:hypothetical protein
MQPSVFTELHTESLKLQAHFCRQAALRPSEAGATSSTGQHCSTYIHVTPKAAHILSSWYNKLEYVQQPRQQA